MASILCTFGKDDRLTLPLWLGRPPKEVHPPLWRINFTTPKVNQSTGINSLLKHCSKQFHYLVLQQKSKRTRLTREWCGFPRCNILHQRAWNVQRYRTAVVATILCKRQSCNLDRTWQLLLSMLCMPILRGQVQQFPHYPSKHLYWKDIRAWCALSNRLK